MPADQPATPKPKLRWFYPTPSRLLIILLAVEVALLLSERFQWFAFNEKKGWTVLIAVAAVGLFLLLMLLWFIVSLIFRWHFQFSIRSLLVLAIAVAVPSSWLAVEMKWAKEQKESVEVLGKLGCVLWYDCQWKRQEAVDLTPGPRGDDYSEDVVYVSIDNRKLNNHVLEVIRDLKHLQILKFCDTSITDADLEYIQGLKQLENL
jgi:hypothetical protein